MTRKGKVTRSSEWQGNGKAMIRQESFEEQRKSVDRYSTAMEWNCAAEIGKAKAWQGNDARRLAKEKQGMISTAMERRRRE